MRFPTARTSAAGEVCGCRRCTQAFVTSKHSVGKSHCDETGKLRPSRTKNLFHHFLKVAKNSSGKSTLHKPLISPRENVTENHVLFIKLRLEWLINGCSLCRQMVLRKKDIFGEEENTKISGKTRKYFDDDGKKPVLIKRSRASACALAN